MAILWNFEPAKSANPTRFLSKIDQSVIKEGGDVFERPREKKPAKVLKNPVLFSGTITVALSKHSGRRTAYAARGEKRLVRMYLFRWKVHACALRTHCPRFLIDRRLRFDLVSHLVRVGVNRCCFLPGILLRVLVVDLVG